MASPKYARAARYRHSGDPRIEQLPGRLDPIDSANTFSLQSAWIRRRLGLPPDLAAIVARLAFAETRS